MQGPARPTTEDGAGGIFSCRNKGRQKEQQGWGGGRNGGKALRPGLPSSQLEPALEPKAYRKFGDLEIAFTPEQKD